MISVVYLLIILERFWLRYGINIILLALLALIMSLYFYFTALFKKTMLQHKKISITLEKISVIWVYDALPEAERKKLVAEIKEEVLKEIKPEFKLKLKAEDKKSLVQADLPDKPEETAENTFDNNIKENIKPAQKINVMEISDTKLFKFYSEIEQYLTDEILKSTIIKLLKFLDKSGDCPSVVDKFADKNLVSVYKNTKTSGELTQYDILAKVSLKEHSLRVAETGINILRQRVKDGVNFYIAPVVCAALAHDIGKIPSLSEQYATGDHPKISIGVLKEFGLPETGNYLDIYNAVLGHHLSPGKDEKMIGEILRLADKSARNMEINNFYDSNKSGFKNAVNNGLDDIIIQADISYHDNNKKIETAVAGTQIGLDLADRITADIINIKEFLPYLVPYINTISTLYNKVQGYYSTKGFVYIPSFTAGTALSKYLKTKDIITTKENRNKYILAYVDELRKADLLFAQVNEGYYSNTLTIISKQNTIIEEKAFGILIKSSAFENLNDIPVPEEIRNIDNIIVSKKS